MILKFLFYIVLILFIYRTLFRPKVIVEHRHFYDKKTPEKKTIKRDKMGDYTDYEEINWGLCKNSSFTTMPT